MEPIITGFKKEGRRAAKIVVLLDGEPWAALDPETVVREHLAGGQTLTDRRRREVLLADETIRARKAAAGYAAHAPKTRRELEHYLAEKGFGPLARRRAIELLAEAGIVDDTAVAGRVARSRRRKGGVGPRKIEAELIGRGVPPGVAARQVGASLEGADLAAECLALARKVYPRYAPVDGQAQRLKFAGFLLRRGYTGEQAWGAVRKVLAENGAEAGDEAEDEG